jgi:hypothetical protein
MAGPSKRADDLEPLLDEDEAADITSRFVMLLFVVYGLL